MSIEQFKQNLPDYAKDIKLNLSNVLSMEGSPELNQKQIILIALACAFTTKNADIIAALVQHSQATLSAEEIDAAKAAATIMAMNNVYYRFTHQMKDESYASMPAKLRMNVMTQPGTDAQSFELSSLAVSAINGCGKCMNAHAAQLVKAGVNKLAIQSAVRIASVVNAAAVAMEIR